MSTYVDGFVIPLAKSKIDQYRVMAEKACEIWRELGALDYVECIGDDLDCEHTASFKTIAGAGPDDTVVFSWITYRSKEHRDEVNAKIMEDPRMKEMMDSADPVFDCKKMAYGGFKPIVTL